MIALRPLPGYFTGLLAASALTLASSYARATCATDAECSKGFACEVVGGSACATSVCPDGQSCPPPPPCDPVEIKDCVPGPCNVDADCADGMVCFSSERQDCPVAPPTPDCPPNTKCDVPPPDTGSCTTTTIKMCVPRYLLPCTAASDCGAGFDCVLDPPSCWCSGGSGTAPPPSSSGGGTDPMPPPASTAPAPAPNPPPGSTAPVPAPAPTGTSCGCTPSTTNHCMPQVIECAANSQCPSGWTCQPVGPSGDRACGVPLLPDGGMGQTICDPLPPQPTTMQCMPPYVDYIGHYYASDSGSLNSALPPEGQIGGTPTGNPAPTPKSGAPSASSGDTGGCQVGHGSAGTGLSVLALAGLIALSRRRSRRLA